MIEDILDVANHEKWLLVTNANCIATIDNKKLKTEDSEFGFHCMLQLSFLLRNISLSMRLKVLKVRI